MKQALWLLQLILKAAVFFTLFAFALNNQQDATVYFFFGTHWTAPMVLIVLTVFTAGLFVGALGMLPSWWKQRQAAKLAKVRQDPAASAPAQATTAVISPAPQHPQGDSVHGI